MKILITGGSGFIGKNLVEGLGAKHAVLAPTHGELELLDEEAVRDYLKEKQVDIVIHGAVRPGHRNAKDPSNQLYNNLRMFFNLARNADRCKKMIVLSSGLVYDQRFYLPKMNEEYFDKHVPVDEGGLSKYITSKYIEKAENIIELRIFGIFGKYEDYAIRFVSNMICKALFDLPLNIKQNRRFDYICIDDLMPIIEYFIEQKGEYKAYNVAPDSSIELYELAEKVRKIAGKDSPIKAAQLGMGIEYSGNNARLLAEIKGLKYTPIDEAIQKLYRWYSDNKNTLNRDLLLVDK
jgi:GDP-L-fucose synthase